GRFGSMFLRNVNWIVSIINGFAIIAPVIAILAAGSTLVPPPAGQDRDLPYFAAQMRRLKEVLNAGSALLVAGILHMGAWLRWPAALVNDKAVQEEILNLALSISVFWGATFTLVIIAIYSPAASRLSAQALRAIKNDKEEGKDKEGEAKDPYKRLNEHGLAISPAQQLPQIAAILAPLLAGPVGSLLSSLATSLD
ncbi:MAG TPA: hypothetical protein VNA16_07810, partial [Abditibacteriaceae bacterium]|nr:hypothetical protein [Abditibacteriaceae bacterium]